MARPLRLERDRARYHVTARGNERRALFRDEVSRVGSKPASQGRVKTSQSGSSQNQPLLRCVV